MGYRRCLFRNAFNLNTMFPLILVNSISWAPHEFGLMLACGASDGAVSVLSTTGKLCTKILQCFFQCTGGFYLGK